ncbi:hypothetical protein [Chryseobacterium sp. MFBS3-17]|uniref:hypothetical protein n=1 Tax=Chryseobacterium sp. MFBS3-17 TaxID=2886689 RepID=UPI001D0F1607|nr:hypothetical protein [Chryseobacterium sp. MFBS3-17]MCC2590004.1 hypothetical protein [Chryseobacterium sp. MFBS3-17]
MIFCTTLLFWSGLAGAQTYSFDYEITAIGNHLGDSRNLHFRFVRDTTKIYVNSEVPETRLMFYRNNKFGPDKAMIYDFRRNLMHDFAVISDRNAPQLQLKYHRSYKYPSLASDTRADSATVHKLQENIYEVKGYKDDRIYVLKASISETTDDLLAHIFWFDGCGMVNQMMLEKLRSELPQGGKYFSKEFTEQYVPGSTFHIAQQAKKKNFKVKLPDTKRLRKLMSKK